ncbi:TonB-dependent receptor [Cocleimonas flava]|uniref:Outer membrane receptor protein involved in Fe transport n=1 Tax=Cocleimonas flava TaxID=634765 RepID=A0A4R1F380_9GAMM|nr:TonB-dependent receptor [Cocleimonas flava]TCJ88233.1 outer membrane receptor protein involved in Fe transport [Cocleimonas flava]
MPFQVPSQTKLPARFSLALTSVSASILVLAPLLSSVSVNAADVLEEVTVTADFRPTTLEESTASISVVTEEEITKRGAQHIEDTLNAAPNVNMASGASRSRFFQIRGIGERSQFISPINPSVGLYIDGMDFSRSGGSATLFDVDQIEVIRGPQGTKYGANALAGIINIHSTEPTNERSGKIEATLGNYGKQSLGIAAGGPLIKDKLLGRFSLHTNQSDGFMENDFLDRDDTADRDEFTGRGHLKWLANDDLTVDLKVLHLDIDNGYDAFTFDNSRTTLSDEPGKDTQKTDAISLKALLDINSSVALEASASYSDSDLGYSYDEDWGYVGQFSEDLYPYSSFDEYLRNRKNTSIEGRLLSNEDGRIFNDKTDWVVGLYHAKKEEGLTRKYTYLESDFLSQYDTENTALYGQLDTEINDKLKLITGLRVEKWKADYTDSNDNKINVDETLHGGKLGLEYELNDNHLASTSISRGYKAGGVNTDGTLPENLLDFDTEYLWNFEVGVNSSYLDDALTTRITAFYAKRKDQQVRSSIVELREDGSTDFTDYIGNAAKGSNYGIEAELHWKVNDKWRLKTSLGLLQAKFDEYTDPQSTANGLDLAGRDQAHAPNYQYSLGAEYSITPKLTAGVTLEGKDGFYFSDRHNARAKAYSLINANLSYKKGDWTATLWGRNLTDKDYDVRGFGSFGNNPGNGYITETYTQKGEPRTVGLTVSLDF